MRPLFFLILSLFGCLTPLSAQTAKQEYIPTKPLLAKAETEDLSLQYDKAAATYGEIINILARQPDPSLEWITYARVRCLKSNKQLVDAEQLSRSYLVYTQKLSPTQPISSAYAYAAMADMMKLRRQPDSAAYWIDQLRIVADSIDTKGINVIHKARLCYETAMLMEATKDYELIINYLETAKESLTKFSTVESTLQLKTLIFLAAMYSYTEQPAKLVKCYNQALTLSKTIPSSQIQWLNYRVKCIELDIFLSRKMANESRQTMIMVENYARDQFGDTSKAYIACLISNGMDCKDRLGDNKTMEQKFLAVQEIVKRLKTPYEQVDLSDMYRNWAYTYLESWSTDSRYDTTYAYFHQAFLLSLSPQYRNLKYNEYPDFNQPDIYQHGFLLTYRSLMAIQYNLFTHYTHLRQPKEKDNLLKIIPVINELKNTLLRNTNDSRQRKNLAYLFEDYYYKKMEMYGDFYGQDSSLTTQKELFITLQQLNSRESRFGVNQQQSLALAGVNKTLISQQEQLNLTTKELNYQLAAAQKLNDKKNVLKLATDISALRNQQAQLEQEIKQKYPRYAQLITQLPTVGLENIQANLADKAMLIYGAARYRTLQMLITKDTIIHYYTFLDRDAVWRKKVDSLQHFLQNPPVNDDKNDTYKQEFYTLLSAISQQFFKQDSFLQANKITDLVVVTDELLAKLPFELILTEPSDAQKGYKDWPFAVKKYKIQYLPDVSFWLQSQNQSKQNSNNGKFLAFAPTYENAIVNKNRPDNLKQLRKNLSELNGAKSEITNLSTYYYGNYYQNQQANEAEFKRAMRSPYAIVHLAMHGLLDEDAAELSALAFSETADSTEDNFLTAYEIAQLRCESQLVVLSACETAAGQNQMGEGVLSLARYFIYGGAPAIVATRWQINDRTTAFIMQNFYKYLYEGFTIKHALQKSQLDYLAQSKGDAAHPFYWAAFTNIGHTDKSVFVASKNWYYKYILISVAVISALMLLYWYKRRRKNQ